MPECYTAAAPAVWPGSFMSACCGTVLPLSFTEEIQTLEGVSIAENVNAKVLKSQTGVERVYVGQAYSAGVFVYLVKRSPKIDVTVYLYHTFSVAHMSSEVDFKVHIDLTL